MNIEQIVSFIEGREPFDQKALSQIMLMLEKYPYFQTGHVLLLKAMHQTQSENYGNQLKISGSFISDKRKLFQFINSETGPAIIITTEPDINKTQNKSKDEKILNKTLFEKKDLVVEKIEKITPIEKTEKTTDIEIIQTEPEKNIIEEKTVTIENNNLGIDKEEKKDTINKADLSEDLINIETTENSKIRHKEIIKDFFQTGHTQKVEKKIIDPDIEYKTKRQQILNHEKTKELSFKNKEEKKQEEIKDDEKIKLEEKIKETSFEEKKIDPKEIDIKEKAIEFEDKKVEIIDNQLEKIKIIEKEPKKEQFISKTGETNKSEGTAEVMSNIFSKIRQIKKEMNITSENIPETIDVKPETERIRIAKNKQTEEKKGSGRVFKESFIGFREEDVQIEKTDSQQENENKEDIEKEEIKEIGITAKDLFKQHLKRKEQIIAPETEKKSNDLELSKSSVISPISKVVANLDEEKSNKIEIEQKITPIAIKETNKEIVETTKTDQFLGAKSILTTSAADSLLQKIQEKKQRMKEEKEREELGKLLERQKMIDLIQNPPIEEENITIKEIIKPIEEQKNEIETKHEHINDKQNEITESLNDEKPEQLEFKVKKSFKLIDNFIEKAESLEKLGSKESNLTGDVSISSADEKEEFMTETMADIQIQQKNFTKAIEIYQKLILKFPEKKTYFAIQIKKVESLIKS